jgi:hypothetical protein
MSIAAPGTGAPSRGSGGTGRSRGKDLEREIYEDAVIPVALAHSYASIPLKTGSRVLTLLSRELLGEGQG